MATGVSSNEGTAAAASQRLTIPFLLRFSFPLALTFIMMAGSAPIVSIGITRMHQASGERIHLQAFLLTFATSVMLYSPLFVARNVATRTVTDRRSLKRYLVFFTGAGAACAAMLMLVSLWDPLGHLLFGRLLGATAEVEQLARRGMLFFVPIPLLIGWRGLGQGSHISNGQSRYVGIGTACRLASMAIFVFAVGMRLELSGPVLGGLTYLTGISVETLMVTVSLGRKRQWRTVETGPTLKYRQYLTYAFPLMVGAVFNQVTWPFLIHLISKGKMPADNSATFDLVRGTGWFLFSMLMTTQPAFVNYATSFRNLRTLLRFSGCLVVGIMTVTALLAMTPLREVVFIQLLEVDNQIILGLMFTALYWMIPVPLANIANLITNALHTRSGRTGWVSAGNIAGLSVLIAASQIFDLSQINGVLIAVVGGATFNLVAAIVQTIGLTVTGLHEVVTPASLADSMNERATAKLAAAPLGRRSPEEVPATSD